VSGRRQRRAAPAPIDTVSVMMRTLNRLDGGSIDDCPTCPSRSRIDCVTQIRPGIYVACCRSCGDPDGLR
jgi:transcription elongation factor Elf1